MLPNIKIKIDHQEVEATPGETIIQVCQRLGIDIPHLCYDPKLKPFSSCFVCVVEVKGYKTHQPACSTVVLEGMEIVTNSPQVHKSRKTALELLLSNHYADCVAPCRLECPAGVDIQGYVSLVEKGLYKEAIALIKETNPLPAICGRVCVRPCEEVCRRQLTKDGTPLGIDYLKRFIADLDLASKSPYTPTMKPQNGKKVAIIGGGPAGLSAAYYLQIAGFQADIYERQPAAGGWLRYGIPEYRLPNAILDQEIDNITKLGVHIFTHQNIDSKEKVGELDKKYDAIFLSIGAQEGDLLGIGERPAPNLISGIDFLKRNAETNNDTDLRGKKVVVVGGGNTAMDNCRTARRCGSEDVLVLYRRTQADMPANPMEIHESKIEGVKYQFLAAPIGVYYHDDEGVNNYSPLRGLKCIRMKAEKQPGSKRSQIVPIEGSEFDIFCDLVLSATGQKVQHHILDQINEYYKPLSLQLNKWKTLDANQTTYQMNIPKIFAAGDAVTGPTNIIQAIAGGKAAAKYMELFIFGKPFDIPIKPFISQKENFSFQQKEEYQDRYLPCKRYEMPLLDGQERHHFDEVELGYSDHKLVIQEAERCLECGCSAFYHCKLQEYATLYGVEQTYIKGGIQKFVTPLQHPQMELDHHKCILCGRCVRVCQEFAGNRALDFFKRGFQTYIAPNIEGNLMESCCDACGLCIDSCPTGAFTENFKEKVLQLPFEKLPIIDPFGSEGFEVDLLAYKGIIYGATARTGIVNRYGLINRDIKFGYAVFNRKDRITQPMARINGVLTPISQEKAIEMIQDVISDETLVCVSTELTNEGLTMIQKWAKDHLKTYETGSFHYYDKPFAHIDSIPLNELANAKHIYLLGAELSLDHPVMNHLVQNLRFTHQIPVTLITNNRTSSYVHKVDEVVFIEDYPSFVQETTFTPESIVMVSEKTKDLPEEWHDARVMLLRCACNAQGLLDLGIVTNQGLKEIIQHKVYKNIFIFGENPMAIHPHATDLLHTASFICTQSLFENETTALSHLILPMNFAIEIGGNYTSSFHVVQPFEAVKPCAFDWNDYRFYTKLRNK